VNVLGFMTVTPNNRAASWFGSIYWFVGTMWVVYLLFPILNTLAAYAAPLNNRFRTSMTMIFLCVLYWFLWLGCTGDNGTMDHYNSKGQGDGFFLQATPWIKIWIFAAGMALGRLLVSGALIQDSTPSTGHSFLDTISPRAWGWVSDVSGVVLGFFTFGPPYYDRDLPLTPETWGYFHNVEKYLLFPLQIISGIIFLFALCSNRGMIATVLNFEPIKSFGASCYAFYLLHVSVTFFTLSNGENSKSLVCNSAKWATFPFLNEELAFVDAYEFEVTKHNIGSVIPLGGLACTYIVAHLVTTYYQNAVMEYAEPCARKLCVPCCGRFFKPCFDCIFFYIGLGFHKLVTWVGLSNDSLDPIQIEDSYETKERVPLTNSLSNGPDYRTLDIDTKHDKPPTL